MIRSLLFVLLVSLTFTACDRETGSEGNGKVIFIHASEREYKREKISFDEKTREKDITLLFSKELKTFLESRGYEVILSETDRRMLTYDEIKRQAKGKDIKALLQIHTTWSPDRYRDKVSGVNLWYSVRLEQSRQLDSLIYRSMYIHSNIMARNLGMLNSVLLNLPDFPCVMIELGNINHPEDFAKMLDPKFRGNMIESISYALDEYLMVY